MFDKPTFLFLKLSLIGLKYNVKWYIMENKPKKAINSFITNKGEGLWN